jgi:Family of unknown function (DUF5681)
LPKLKISAKAKIFERKTTWGRCVAVDETLEKQPNGDDYEVGYKRPPVQTRFQPGCSGNPKGRPKGAKNFKAELQEELNERVRIKEGERTKRVSKQRAIIKTLVKHTLQGDPRAMKTLLDLVYREPVASAPDVLATDELTGEEDELLTAIKKQLQAEHKPTIVPQVPGEEGINQ